MKAMQTSMYSIRAMMQREIDMAVDWAAAEGWNPGNADASCFHAADPDGFLVGLLDGEPVATISAVRYGAAFGFVGFYIVKPDQRGKGYGLAIWKAAMDRLAGRTVGLDGVVSEQDKYKRSGFVLAYRGIRYESVGGSPVPLDPNVVDLSALPAESVLKYDKPFFPDDRSAFVRAWVSQPNGVALGILREGRLAGYGVLRPCRTGFKIGPLFADAPDLAERLFNALRTRAPTRSPVFLDIPEANGEALALVKRHGMTAMFETARMYKGPAPTLPLDRLFGVTSFELG